MVCDGALDGAIDGAFGGMFERARSFSCFRCFRSSCSLFASSPSPLLHGENVMIFILGFDKLCVYGQNKSSRDTRKPYVGM